MWVISKKKLRDFWESPGYENSKGQLEAWYRIVNNKETDWGSFQDVKQTYGNASLVGDCVVFNICGNQYRLIAIIVYPSRKVLIRGVFTHKEYDEGKWKQDCGCLKTPSDEERSKTLKDSKAGRRRRLSRRI